VGDFHQNGKVTTLHNLTQRPIDALERELLAFSRERPLGLVLPSLYSELRTPALEKIVQELRLVPYLSEIIIGLDAADRDQFAHACKYFARLPQHHRILWQDGPRLRALDAKLAAEGLAPTQPGKGRNVWYCYGYALASRRADGIALHDCDISTYERDLLARLIYPIANNKFSFEFCKGYYARVTETHIGGRVTRLLMTPLIRAMSIVCGRNEFLDFLDSFRYPLAGEFAIRRDVINDLRIPSDWGLEIGVLSEIHRNYANNRICQVDIASRYDHKHQELSPDDASRGLSKMSTDISKAVFRKLAILGQTFSIEKIRTIKATYYRIALDFVEVYEADASINGLAYDRHAEERAVELFASNIVTAGAHFLENPMDAPFIPAWTRVISAVPDVLGELYEAVEKDREEFQG